MLQALGTLARPQDKVMLVLSTHGAPNLLSVHAGNEQLGMLQTADLVKWLAPLREHPNLVVISACFSGSFISGLRNPKGIMLTAAARDRASFGCDSRSDDTYFIKALLGQPDLATLTLREAMKRAIDGVAQQETEMKLSPPSMPQQYYGSEAQAWSRQPIGAWLKPLQPAGVSTTDAVTTQ